MTQDAKKQNELERSYAAQITEEGLVTIVVVAVAAGLVFWVSPSCINLHDTFMLWIAIACWPMAAALMIWLVVWLLADARGHTRRRKALQSQENTQ